MTNFDHSIHPMLDPLPSEPFPEKPQPASPLAALKTFASLDQDTFQTDSHVSKPLGSALAVLTCGNCGYKLAAGSLYCPQCLTQFSSPMPAVQANATPPPIAVAVTGQEQTNIRGAGKYLGWVVAACVIAVLLLLSLLLHSTQTAFSASTMPHDTDLEINGTYDKEYGKFAVKGRITNTSQNKAPNVEIDSAMYGFTLGDHYDAHDTVVVDTLHNLLPGETREFDYRIDVPQVVNGKPWLTEGMALKVQVKP